MSSQPLHCCSNFCFPGGSGCWGRFRCLSLQSSSVECLSFLSFLTGFLCLCVWRAAALWVAILSRVGSLSDIDTSCRGCGLCWNPLHGLLVFDCFWNTRRIKDKIEAPPIVAVCLLFVVVHPIVAVCLFVVCCCCLVLYFFILASFLLLLLTLQK